jgi:hypothetical protein
MKEAIFLHISRDKLHQLITQWDLSQNLCWLQLEGEVFFLLVRLIFWIWKPVRNRNPSKLNKNKLKLLIILNVLSHNQITQE